jgi:heptosyltransferase I
VSIPDAWTRGRVCVVAMSGIGDTVHTLPVLTALKRHAPACHITCILQSGGAALVERHPAIDRAVVFRRDHGLLAAYRALRAALREPFDLVLDLNVAAKASIATLMLRADVKLGFDRARARELNWLVTTHRIPPHPNQHVQDQYFEFLTALGVPNDNVVWNLGPWADEREAQRAFFGQLDRKVVTLVIGTSDPEREWLSERWAELSDALVERYGLQPVLAGGRSPRELATERAILARARHQSISTLGWPLRDLVWLLDGSALAISLDTAPLHMSVALDRPVIMLAGSWNPKRTGPYRRFHDLLVDAYGEPGEDYPITTEKRKNRMPHMTVADVLAKVERWKTTYADRR